MTRQLGNGARQPVRATAPVYDFIGLGFGPANLSLAVANEERGSGARPLRGMFLEQKQDFSWHPGMLIGDAELQVCFLKDLALLRNPRSPFTFLNYLHAHDRLCRFANLRSFFPSRVEFNDYLRWVAAQFGQNVRYGERVVEIRVPTIAADGRVDRLVVTTETASGERREYVTRNVVLGVGAVPNTPGVDVLSGAPRVFHSGEFVKRIGREFPDPNAAFHAVVVGAGQSAAEIVDYLLGHYENSQVTALMRRFSFRQADESHFVNELFAPDSVERMFALDPAVRRELLATHGNTNYAAVDVSLIERLYGRSYADAVAGKNRLSVLGLCEFERVRDENGRLLVEYTRRGAGTREALPADLLVLATGYTWPRRHPLLDSLAPHLVLDAADGAPRVERSYRVATAENRDFGIYLQGYAEGTHGLTDTLFSILPFRASEILADMEGRCAAQAVSAEREDEAQTHAAEWS